MVLAAAINASALTGTEHTIAGVSVETTLLYRELFENLDNWRNLAPRTHWEMKDRTLRGSWAPGGSALWLDREFQGNLLIVATARVLPPEPAVAVNKPSIGGKNINIRFHVRGPGDTDILDVYHSLLSAGTGANGIGDDQYRGYFVTWTGSHSRIRRSPGYENVSEDRTYLPRLGQDHSISLLFLDGRIVYSVDERQLHDYTDPRPYTRGKIALLTWNSKVAFTRFEVYQVTAITE